MFMRHHGGGVGHTDPTEAEEAENLELEEVDDDDRSRIPGDLIKFDDSEDESEGEGDEEAANTLDTYIRTIYFLGNR